MKTLQYSPEAVADLQRLREFIRVTNPIAAEKVARELVSGTEKLKTFPKMGFKVTRAPDPDKMRDLYIADYTIRYLISSDTIYILRLWHNKENEKNQ